MSWVSVVLVLTMVQEEVVIGAPSPSLLSRFTHPSDVLIDGSLPRVLRYILDSDLVGCGVSLYLDMKSVQSVGRGHGLVGGGRGEDDLVRLLGQPVSLAALTPTQEGGLTLPNITITARVSTCSVYIFVSEDDKGVRGLVESGGVEEHLDYLGRYIFVTGAQVGAPEFILDNEVMTWRPHAIVVKKSERWGESGEWEVWSHHLFRDNAKELVYLADRWQRGRLQNGAPLFPNKLENFHGSQLRAVTFEHAPSIVDVHDEHGGHAYDGIDIRLLHILSEALNFQLKIVNPSDGGKWGSPLGNGSWTGLTGDLTQHRAHMGVANLFIHIQYLEVVDMTVPYDMEFGCFITPLPEPLPQWVALVYPFSLQVWVIALVCLGIGTILLHLTSISANHLLKTESAWATTFSHNVFYGTGIFFGVSMPQVPRSDVTRSYFIMWVWYGLLLTVVYRSSLTAFLTIPLTQAPINTLQELVSSNLPAWGATGLTFKKMLEENPDPMVQQLALRYQPVSGAEEGIHLTAQRKYAMMENRQFLEYMIATNYTNKYGEETLHVMAECFLPFRIGMAMPKKAPYKPNFDRVVQKVVEAGLVRKWFSDIIFSSRKRGSGEARRGEEGHFLSIIYSATPRTFPQGAWLLLGSGLVGSLASFVAEMMIRWR